MAKIGLRQAQRLALLLSGEIGGRRKRSAEPAVEPFSEMSLLASALHREEGVVRLGVFAGSLCVGKHRFRSLPPPLLELCRLLEEKGVSSIILKPEVSARDLMVLARLMGEPGSGAAQLIRGLCLAGVTSLEIKEDDPLTRGYSEAIVAIREIFREVDGGAVPDIAQLLPVVKKLAAAAVEQPAALLGLIVTKDYEKYSFHHSVNVGVLSLALAAAMGQTREEIEETGLAGFLHDVGKSRIDWRIVSKPGKLTSREYAVMKRHPEYGARIISRIPGLSGRIAEAVLGHHIRFDRQGYPEWAREWSFGIIGGIVAVADCYDAITTFRAYQQQLQPLQAVEEIRSQCGTSLEPEIVERFLELVGKFPVGSVVRLDSGEIGVVLMPSSDDRGAATVRVVVDSSGRSVSVPVLESLEESGARIVGLVDPESHGIDVTCCF